MAIQKSCSHFGYCMMKIALNTVSQIEKVIKTTKTTTAYPIAGTKGLELNVRVGKQGTVADFRHRYTHPITGKRPYMTLGSYPTFMLEQARKAYNDNLSLIAQNIDPLSQRELDRQKQAFSLNNTFGAVAMSWFDENKDSVMPKTVENWKNLIKPLMKHFKNTPIDSITTPQILQFLKGIQKDHIQKGNLVKGIANRIFAYAVINGLIEHNPVLQLTGARALKPTRTKHHPAIIEPLEFSKLLQDIHAMPAQTGNFNKQILQLLALWFVRIDDLCSMKWCDVDFVGKTWTFRPQKGQNRADMVDSLVIPLAPQAIAILQDMYEITGGMEYVFYNGRRKLKPYANKGEINKLLNSNTMNDGQSYKGIHTPHGFRASARTMLEERLDFDYRLIEMQLGHNVRDVNGRAYNRVKWLDKRQQMMNAWANYLDDLLAGKVDNVIYFNHQTRQPVNRMLV